MWGTVWETAQQQVSGVAMEDGVATRRGGVTAARDDNACGQLVIEVF